MSKRDASHFITEYYTEGGKVELMIPTDAADDDFALLREMLDLIEAKLKRRADRKTEQTDCYVSDLCKHYGDKQICGRCRSRNLFCEAEPQPRCPKCGKRGYIRSLESMGVKLNVFDEYRWKCTNCNNYFKEEPKTESQTEYEKYREKIRPHDPHKDWFEDEPQTERSE